VKLKRKSEEKEDIYLEIQCLNLKHVSILLLRSSYDALPFPAARLNSYPPRSLPLRPFWRGFSQSRSRNEDRLLPDERPFRIKVLLRAWLWRFYVNGVAGVTFGGSSSLNMRDQQGAPFTALLTQKCERNNRRPLTSLVGDIQWLWID
jgi:hypothetical protein